MAEEKKILRPYNSPARQQRAEETRRRIALAAEALIQDKGYENATIGTIAARAGVAPQTVYAAFGSKQGILIWLLRRVLEQNTPDTDFSQVINQGSAAEMAREMSRLAHEKHRQSCSSINALGGFEALYPELSALARETHLRGREQILRGVREGLAMRSMSLDPRQEKLLTDILWVFTDGHLYHLLVGMAGWSEEHYGILLQKLLEMVMRDLAPEILRDIDDTQEGA